MSGLKLYSDLPARRTGQVVTDLVVLAWVVVWVLVGRAVHAAVTGLGAFGTSLEDGATELATRLGSAGSTAADLPLVGDQLSGPLTGAGDAASGLAAAGRSFTERTQTLGTWLGVLVAATPILLVVLAWAAVRLTGARRAAATAAAGRSVHGLDLLALRALATRPLRELETVGPDPVTAWRNGDPVAVRRLAELEARAGGVRLRDLPSPG